MLRCDNKSSIFVSWALILSQPKTQRLTAASCRAALSSKPIWAPASGISFNKPETDFDLPSIKEPTVIFRGTPADAGRLYPKNANLAVTVALCGAGLDRTEIELVADPTLPAGTNASRLEVSGDSGELKMERLGRAMPDNPKTGVLTALTMADDLMKMVRASDW